MLNLLCEVVNYNITGVKKYNDNDYNDVTTKQWHELFHLSRAHQLHVMVYDYFNLIWSDAFKETVVYKDWKVIYQKLIIRHSLAKQSTREIINKIPKDFVDMMIIKGFDIERLYIRPEYRLMGDIDLLVHYEDVEKVMTYLESFGYSHDSRYESEKDITLKHHLAYSIELHHHLFLQKDYGAFTNFDRQVWKHKEAYHESVVYDRMNVNDNIIYLIVHMVKHIYESGIGLRQFVDLALVIKKGSEIDYTYIKEGLIQFNVYEISCHIFGILEMYFDVETGFETEVEKFRVDELLAVVMRSGTFGKETEYIIEQIYYQQYELNQKKTSFGNWIGVIFPPLSVVKKHAPYLETKPYLLPYAWFVRLIRAAKRKNGLANNLLGSQMDLDILSRKKELFDYFQKEQ